MYIMEKLIKTIFEEEKGMAFKLLTEREEKKQTHLVKISCGSLTLYFNDS